jgi:hypothetical protein
MDYLNNKERIMGKNTYKVVRRFIRQNGWAYAVRAFRTNPDELLSFEIEHLRDIHNEKDKLAERANIVSYCIHEGLDYNFRHLA